MKEYRNDFPILGRKIYEKYPLVYLDNAATTQKPRQVVEAMTEEYYNVNANVHRGVHFLSQQATDLMESSRETVRRFLNAGSTSEIIFTRGTTESINLVAQSFGEKFMREGDEVIISEMEHHSNIVAHDVPVLVDGAQSTPHFAVDVREMDCDFFAFSGHKVYGPTGVGVLYGKERWLEQMPPYMGGGEMIKTVSFERTTFNDLPYKFEAGTPDYVATTGLARALDYVSAIGMDRIAAHERDLTQYAMQRLQTVEGMKIFGPADGRDAVVSFQVGDIHHLDMGTLLDRLGIAIRTGHHCAEPLMRRLGVEGTCRASFALYNTREEVDALVEGIERVRKMF